MHKFNRKALQHARRIKYSILMHVLLLIPSISFTKSLSAKASLSSQRSYRSVYFLGRGDTGIAESKGHEAIFYNPALLAVGKGLYKETVFLSPRFELSKNTRDLVNKLAIEKKNDPNSLRSYIGQNNHIEASNFTGIVFRRGALGILLNSASNFLLAKDPDQGALEYLSAESVTDQMITFSFAETIGSFFHLGSTIKYYHQQNYAALEVGIADASDIGSKIESDDVMKAMRGYGVDIGLLMKGDLPVSLGLTIENLGQTQLDGISKNYSRSIKPTINLGTSYTIDSHLSHMSFLMDIRDLASELESNLFKKTYIGTELAVGDFMGLTGGFHQGYPSFGIWSDFYLLRVDISMYTEEISASSGLKPDTRYAFQMMLKI